MTVAEHWEDINYQIQTISDKLRDSRNSYNVSYRNIKENRELFIAYSRLGKTGDATDLLERLLNDLREHSGREARNNFSDIETKLSQLPVL